MTINKSGIMPVAPGPAREEWIMENKITWEMMLDTAMKKSRSKNMPVLVEFFDPNCIGCQQMEKITFPDPKVKKFINENLIPVRVRYDDKPMAAIFNIHWTPTFLMLDSDEMEHHRIVGFLPPEEFIPAMMLGIDKMYFDTDRFDSAIENIDKLLSDYPKSNSAPEAVYLRGVSMFKTTHDPKLLKEAHERLVHDYPTSDWTRRADPYRLL
jgi:thioredoxin-related protein